MSINNVFYQSYLSQMNDFDVQSEWKKEPLLGRQIWQIKKSDDSTFIKIHHIKISAFQNFIKFISDLFSLNWDVKIDVSTKNIDLKIKFDYLDIKMLEKIIIEADLENVKESLLKNYQSASKADTVYHEILSVSSSKKKKTTSYAEQCFSSAVALFSRFYSQKFLADRGDGAAQYNVGAMYEEGREVARDYQEAIKYYRMAADQGNLDAQFNIGLMYHHGLGVVRDFQEALRHCTMAADHGNSDAQYTLGNLYEDGYRVDQDYEKAMKYYKLAADQGDARAQFRTGDIYYGGCGVAQNYQAAMEYYRLAAEQGHADAQFSIGSMYENGHGVEQDYQEAVKYYKLTADQGHLQAQRNLERLLENKE